MFGLLEESLRSSICLQIKLFFLLHGIMHLSLKSKQDHLISVGILLFTMLENLLLSVRKQQPKKEMICCMFKPSVSIVSIAFLWAELLSLHCLYLFFQSHKIGV